MSTSDPLQYPIGAWQSPDNWTPEDVSRWIQDIADLPAQLESAVSSLSDEELDIPYRPGGWTARQVIHHVGDSHINSYVRFKLALTEDTPTITGYDQDGWAALPDTQAATIDSALRLIRALHEKWVVLLQSLTPEDLKRGIQHSESGFLSLADMLSLYSWHGRHHLAHVQSVKKQ